MLKKFSRIATATPDLSVVQGNLESCLGPALSKIILDGVQISNVALKAGANTINNPLGRDILGLIVVRKNAASDVFDQQAANQLSTKTIVLQASSAVTVDLWVY